MRWLGDTRSGTPSPSACQPHAEEQAHARQPAAQQGRHRGVEVSDGDWGGDCKTEDPANERAAAIGGRQPAQSSDRYNGCPNAKDASDESADEESRLPSRIAQYGADQSAEARQNPGGEEHGNGLHKNLQGSGKWSVRLTNRA